MRYPSGTYNQIGLINPNNLLNRNIWSHIKSSGLVKKPVQKKEINIGYTTKKYVESAAQFSPRGLKAKSGFVSFMGHAASSGANSPQDSQDPPKEFILVQQATSQKINWFEVNLMENEDDQFTLGFEDQKGQFWIKNRMNKARLIQINLEQFAERGAQIDEIMAYLAHNLQHDIQMNSNKGLTMYLAGKAEDKPIIIKPNAHSLVKNKNYSKMSSNFNIQRQIQSNLVLSEPSMERPGNKYNPDTPTLIPAGSDQQLDVKSEDEKINNIELN